MGASMLKRLLFMQSAIVISIPVGCGPGQKQDEKSFGHGQTSVI